jgi:hypothetical protein
MDCSLRRHGFETRASRNSHEKEHEKPWKCNVEGCEFENGGFLSRKMRDEHLEQFHTPHNVPPNGGLENLDDADLRNVCLDLIKADDVSRIRELAAAGLLNKKFYLDDLISCAAQCASPETMKTLLSQKGIKSERSPWHGTYSKLLLPQVVAGGSSEMLEYILQSDLTDWEKLLRRDLDYHTSWTGEALETVLQELRGNGLSDVLAKGNDEMLGICCKWVEQDMLKNAKRRYIICVPMIAATKGDTYREHILLGLWKKIPTARWTMNHWKNAIVNVASTTCSTKLAKFLIDQGVPVDWRNSKAALTPLVHASRNTTVEAAELVRVLLFNGAEIIVEIVKNNNRARLDETLQKSEIRVSELKGARQISKWLGVSFDELVAQAKKARGEVKSSDS